MVEAAERLVRRWQRRPDGRVVDVALEMTRVTLDVLERTIFTQGRARDPDALGRAITRYFEGHRPGRSARHLRLPGLGAPDRPPAGTARRSGSSRRWSAS